MMQLGTRWRVGTESPTSLSEDMRARIASVEAELEYEEQDASLWYWTLTWLENHPRAELENGTIVREDYDGSIIEETGDDLFL